MNVVLKIPLVLLCHVFIMFVYCMTSTKHGSAPSPLGSLSENVSGGKNDEFIFIFDLVFAFYYSEQNRDKIWK
jgi:hypothetical protein